MIALLRGVLLEKHPNQAIVDVGGVGYDVTIPVSTYAHLPDAGAEVRLRIHTHVREDALALFGFLTQDEKALFEKLISVSGIGPKMAMAVLSGIPALDLIANIRRGEVDRLVRIPGVGKKTAERMVLELRDKMPAPSGEEIGSGGRAQRRVDRCRAGCAFGAAESGMRAPRGRSGRTKGARGWRASAAGQRLRAAFPARLGTGTVTRQWQTTKNDGLPGLPHRGADWYCKSWGGRSFCVVCLEQRLSGRPQSTMVCPTVSENECPIEILFPAHDSLKTHNSKWDCVRAAWTISPDKKS